MHAEATLDLASLLGRPIRTIDMRPVEEAVKGKRVLITGAGGTIGSELARTVAQMEPAQLVMMDKAESALFSACDTVRDIFAPVASLGDICDAPPKCRPEIILHCAAHKHVGMSEDFPALCIRNNCLGTAAALEFAKECDARFLLISTDKAVDPVSVMGTTKAVAERMTLAQGHPAVRFGNVLGSAGSVLTIWERQIRAGRSITVVAGATRLCMTIWEAAQLVLRTLAWPDRPCVYALDMGEPVSIETLARRLCDQFGAEHRFEYVEARGGEKRHESLYGSREHPEPTDCPHIFRIV